MSTALSAQSRSATTALMFPQTVKLVIWDLDDTFWKGTLSEGPIEPIPENLDLVQTLAKRGIISSICSKNDFVNAEHKLRELGAWDFFVFPVIQWNAKGTAIKSLIHRAKLRPENVVFIDNSSLNRAEAIHSCPDLTCLPNPQMLSDALEKPHLKGSPDPDLSRLLHYRLLAQRDAVQQQADLSNVEFLRQCQITIEISYDVEDYLDRIIDLLNRSNQLNFTKLRIDSEAAKTKLESQFSTFGYKAGVVSVRDRYGDYGVVGFFLTHRTFKAYQCEHFVFSCRILNMGVEQYVYNHLNRPSICICEPVANPIDSFEHIDWISDGKHDHRLHLLKQQELLLVGGCDMLQLTTYCSMRSTAFTNRAEGDLMVRFDDPHFFLANREIVQSSKLRCQIPAWDADDMAAFARCMRSADVVVLSIYEMLSPTYFLGTDGLTVRFYEDTVRKLLASKRAMWFVRNFGYVPLTFAERLQLVRRSIEKIVTQSHEHAQILIMLQSTRRLDADNPEAQRRRRYNDFICSLCTELPRTRHLDVDAVVKDEWILNAFHMSRQAYLALAQQIIEQTQM